MPVENIEIKSKGSVLWGALVALGWLCGPALAGPPGALDDPHAIGKGNVEFILAASGAEQAGDVGIQGPILDFTLGVTDDVDFLVVGQGFHVVRGDAGGAESGVFMTGFKWQLISGPDWTVAWTPGVYLEINGEKRVAVTTAFQVERNLGRFAAGLDTSYTWIDDDSDVWRGGLYGLYSATEELTLLGEVFFENSALGVTLGLGGGTRATDVSFNLGFDWEMLPDTHLLVSGGTGIASYNQTRIGWQTYVGIQWCWGSAEPSDDRGPLMGPLAP
ncbi:MAG: hypothetical protein P8Q97_13355 [Myxococcota bacterium]|nr:hypothetical protein [Myxococcota bacterium]